MKCTVNKKHVYTKVSNDPGRHACQAISYCMHYLTRCACGKTQVAGYAVPELR